MRPCPGVTPRAVLIGLALLPVNVYWIIYTELVRGGIWPTVMTLLFTAVTTLALLIGVNLAVARRWPVLALSRAELLTIYTMLSVGSALAGTDVLQTLIHTMGRSTWYATPENGWATRITPYLPDWLVVKDREILRGFYEGSSSLYRPAVLAAWCRPLGAWLLFIAAMLTTMFSLNVLSRRQWADAERLNYPIISLPIELTRTDPPFLRQPLLWVGICLAGGLDVLNGLHHLYPSVPMVNTKVLVNLNEYLLQPPWSGVGWMPITIYPFAIGLGFLIPLDLVFSCWFFYLVWKAERVFVTAYALDPTCMRASFDGPYSQEQVTGVWIATLLYTAWSGRAHLRVVWEGIRSGERGPREAMGYRVAALLAIAGAFGMVAFLMRAGMAPVMAAVYVAIYLALSFYLARMRAEVGPPAHDMYGAGPDMVLGYALGPGQITPATRGVLASLYWLNRESCRSHPMPAHAEALRAGDLVGSNPRRLWWLLLGTAILGAFVAMWACLHLTYRLGAIRELGPSPSFADEGLRRVDSWTPAITQPEQRLAIAAGAIIALLGMAARSTWMWWPLHPMGYAVSAWWAINSFWFPLMLATILKGLLLRYSGLTGYRRALPFFLGLVLGEFVVGGLWQLVGALLNTNTYAFWV